MLVAFDVLHKIMSVHLLSTPRVLAKLRSELKAAIPNTDQPISILEIEQLSYLSAVITEGFRLAMGTSQRQTRINPEGVMVLADGEKQWQIPQGVSFTPSLQENIMPSCKFHPIPVGEHYVLCD